MKKLKKNVDEFNRDVAQNEGYRYTSNAPFSSIVANRRLTEVTIENIAPEARTLIDIGCGDGTYTADIHKALQRLKIDGTDPASLAIASAKEKFKSIKFFVSNILDRKTFETKAEKYDVGVIRGVLHHLTDPVLAVKNSLALAPDLIIIEPNGNNPVVKLLEKKSKYHIEHEERSFSLKQLKEFCAQAKAEVTRVQFVGYVPFFFPGLLARVIYFFQPFLECIPGLRYFFAGQIIICCRKKAG